MSKAAARFDRRHQRAEPGLKTKRCDDPEIATRIAQYEMAFKMQSSVPDLMDMSKEPQSVLDAYGAQPGDGSFASNCLLARRLAERGVRFIQLYHRDWDHHSGRIKSQRVAFKAEEVDRPTAALITDLKQRGMLDDTLVVWGGEFGRTPMSQSGDGRDHHIKGSPSWWRAAGSRAASAMGDGRAGLCGGGESGQRADFHATMLHLLGIDHKRLTVKFQGLDARLTGIAGNVFCRILSHFVASCRLPRPTHDKRLGLVFRLPGAV
jgi:hypothetical protein